VKIHRVIAKRIDFDRDGINVRADISAAIVANVNESGGEATAHSEQRIDQEPRQTARSSSRRRHKPGASD
jgi:hypothetical protein